MSAYVVLARKWRSAQFEDIVGQGPIVRTLMNAIAMGRIHQAYLFTGPRGIGKTSIARIFAKVLRCPNVVKDENGVRSCDECSACKEIAHGNSVDVIEIDGASNNGVDAVREIRESAKYLPSTGDKKIYIIDEVHMLTTAAFNALLKTLEEPPPHVHFVFATTEPHKIPATILSRVQRFDFRRASVTQIEAHLEKILKAESVAFEEGALSLIARAAEGSIRDSLSILDQTIAYAGDRITAQAVRDSIGLVQSETLLETARSVLSRNVETALKEVDKVYEQGHDLRVFTKGLIETLHGVILAKLGVHKNLSSSSAFGDEEWDEVEKLTGLREMEELEMIFQVLHHGMDWIARSPQPKVVLDILLIKCATAQTLFEFDGKPPEGGRNATASSPTPVQPSVEGKAPTGPAFNTSSHVPPEESRPSQVLKTRIEKSREESRTSAINAAIHPEKAQTPKVPTPKVMSGADAEAKARGQDIRKSNSEQGAQPANPPAGRPKGPLNWESFVQFARSRRPLLSSILEFATEGSLPSGELLAGTEKIHITICFHQDDAYKKEQLEAKNYRMQLDQVLGEYLGLPDFSRLQLDFKTREDTGESMVSRRQRETREKEARIKETIRNHPVIQEARSTFGAELGPVELIAPAKPAQPGAPEGGNHAVV